MLDRERGGGVERIGARPRADLGMLEAETVARHEQAADLARQQVTDRGERSAERPHPRCGLEERMLPQVGGHHHAAQARGGGDVADEPLDGDRAGPFPELHVVADHGGQQIDRPIAGQQRVERIDAAAEAERRRRAPRAPMPRRHDVGRLDRGIPELAKGGREAAEIPRPDIAGRGLQVQR
ncbi:MAG: hypothetical protein ACK559_09625, partial [bacterium]